MENEIRKEALELAVVCRILRVARSSFYYRPRDRAVVIDDVLAQPIKHLIDAEPYLGYRMVASASAVPVVLAFVFHDAYESKRLAAPDAKMRRANSACTW